MKKKKKKSKLQKRPNKIGQSKLALKKYNTKPKKITPTRKYTYNT